MKYHITAGVNQANGHQVWEVKANSPKEALQKFREGEGDVVHEEIEVYSLEEVTLADVEEVTE